jgi:hypothetical protein
MSLHENSLWRRQEKCFISSFRFSLRVGIASCSNLLFTYRTLSHRVVNRHATNQVGNGFIHCKFQGRISLKTTASLFVPGYSVLLEQLTVTQKAKKFPPIMFSHEVIIRIYHKNSSVQFSP